MCAEIRNCESATKNDYSNSTVPNIMTLNSGDLIEWMRNRKKSLGLTNAKLSELSNVPEGTIDRILSQHYTEFRYSSIQPLMAVLIGLQDKIPDPNPNDSEQNSYYYDTIEGYKLALENKNHEIEELKNTISKLTSDVNFLRCAYEDRTRMLQESIEHRKWMERLIDDLRKDNSNF